MEKVVFKNRKTLNPENVICDGCLCSHKKSDHAYWTCVQCKKYILCQKCNELNETDWDRFHHDCKSPEEKIPGGFMCSSSSGRGCNKGNKYDES